MNPIVQGVTVAVAIGIVFAIGRLAHKRMWVPTANVFKNLSTLLDDVKLIKDEVMSNGGGSLKDQVGFVSKQTNENTDLLVLLEARWRGLIGSIAPATFEANFMFSWTDVNLSVERLTGYGFTRLERRQWLSHVHDDDRDDVIREITAAIADGREIGASFKFVTNFGEIVNLRMSATPVFSKVKKDSILCWTGHLFKDDEADRRERERRA